MEIKTTYAEGSPCTIIQFNGHWTALTEEQCKEMADEANRAFAIRRFMRVVLDELKEAFESEAPAFSQHGSWMIGKGLMGEISFSVYLGEEATEDGAGMPIRTYRISAFTVTKMVAYDDGDGFYEFNDREFERHIEAEMEGLEA